MDRAHEENWHAITAVVAPPPANRDPSAIWLTPAGLSVRPYRSRPCMTDGHACRRPLTWPGPLVGHGVSPNQTGKACVLKVGLKAIDRRQSASSTGGLASASVQHNAAVKPKAVVSRVKYGWAGGHTKSAGQALVPGPPNPPPGAPLFCPPDGQFSAGQTPIRMWTVIGIDFHQDCAIRSSARRRPRCYRSGGRQQASARLWIGQLFRLGKGWCKKTTSTRDCASHRRKSYARSGLV